MSMYKKKNRTTLRATHCSAGILTCVKRGSGLFPKVSRHRVDERYLLSAVVVRNDSERRLGQVGGELRRVKLNEDLRDRAESQHHPNCSAECKRTWLSDVYCGQVVSDHTLLSQQGSKADFKRHDVLGRPFPSLGVPLTANDTQ